VLRKEFGMSRVLVAPSTQALLRLVEGPAMLSKHIQIGKYIVDAVIMDVHPEMARWYGYNSPTEMQGRYLSQVHDPHCLAQVRLYAVARQLGLPGVPEEYDIQITLPNGRPRWLRKQQVRQITEGDAIYWISHSIPIPARQARPMPAVCVPLSARELEGYLGRCTVVDAERLIETTARARHALFDDTTLKGTATQQETALGLQRGEGGQSVELPLGHPRYRRWLHTCNRCQRRWVAEKAAPKKCIHCKSPYWNLPRERRGPGGRRRPGDAAPAGARHQP
jgi:hypothetical protein